MVLGDNKCNKCNTSVAIASHDADNNNNVDDRDEDPCNCGTSYHGKKDKIVNVTSKIMSYAKAKPRQELESQSEERR